MVVMRRKRYEIHGRGYTPGFRKLDRSKVDEPKMKLFWDVPGLHGLNRNEKEKIEELLQNPGKDEIFFFRQLFGKTPAQVRNLMTEEFIRRFDLAEYADEIWKGLPSRRSWLELDIAIAKFAGMLEVEEHCQFWDRMRYVLAALPQKKDYSDKYMDSKALETASPKRRWKYDTCMLCWRSVPYRVGRAKKRGQLCFMHNLPSTHSIYRRRSGLRESVWIEKRTIAKRLKEQLPQSLSDEDRRNRILSLMTAQNDCLPRLVDYLDSVRHNGEPESLLWAFHGPASDEMDALYQEGLGEFIQTVLTTKNIFDPRQPLANIFTVDELSSAEAWLAVLDRDGRRKTT